MDVGGKAAIITGGGTGVGRATALELARRGCSVLVNYSRSREDAEKTAAELSGLGVRALAFQADVAEDSACRGMVEAALREFGRLDILVNNAATTVFIPHNELERVTDDDWDRLMAVNLKGLFNCCKAAVPAMKSQGYGKIINISSSTWLSGTTGRLHYTTSKAGVVGFTRSISHDLGKDGICVNAVCPGLTKSETIAAVMPEAHWQRRQAKMAESAAIPRLQKPEDLVGTILFLLSAASDYVTGQTIACEGGANHL